MRKTGVPGYLNSVEGPGESEENPIYIVEDDDSPVETPDFMTQNAPEVSEGDRFALQTSPPNFAVFTTSISISEEGTITLDPEVPPLFPSVSRNSPPSRKSISPPHASPVPLWAK